MKCNWMEPAYEAARMWALHPVSHPPSGWAQILCGGIATWMRERHPPLKSPSPQPARLSVSRRVLRALESGAVMGLDGQTPADREGIRVEGENNWLTIIQNAKHQASSK